MTALNIGTAKWEVQVAIKARLTGDSAHMALLAGDGIYDEPSQNVPFPYQTIGDISETVSDTFQEGMRTLTATIDTWSRYKGNKEASAIQDSEIKLLHRAALALASLHCVGCRCTYDDIQPDPDGLTRHGVTRYEIVVQATS